MLEFLPPKIYNAIQNINTNLLYEIRLRANQPIMINYSGKYLYLTKTGTSLNASMAMKGRVEDIEECILKASEYSIYSVTEQIQQGFITAKSGERIGLAGAYVYEQEKLQNIREITSINIRVPHCVVGCANLLMEYCFQNGLVNLLLCSSAGCGKTTILRDLTRQISLTNIYNLLISDERNEISATQYSTSFDFGRGIDVIRYAKKEDAFKLSMRAMRPDMIITDEIVHKNEIDILLQTHYAGVHIIATTHCNNLQDLKNNFIMQDAFSHKLFRYYAFLRHGKVGEVDAIYNQNFQLIYQAP